MNVTEVWDKACRFLQEEMNEVSYKTWIASSLKPLEIEDGCLYIEVVTDYMKQMIAGRYAVLIANAVSQAAGHALAVEIITPQESAARRALKSAPAPQGAGVSLNPRYTFDTFVVGSGNRFAHAASLAVAEAPAEAYNPLFIYGGVGLGKTHLMHAIGHYVQRQYPSRQLLYITSENFTNEFITAIQKNKNAEFRARFRSVDILMVDDIQFIAKLDRTQEEFFHTFNALHAAGKQIIMTSDKPPKDIASLEERLCSRFEWGLIADIQRPDLETRIAILRRKAEREHIAVPDGVLEMIAQRIDSNIRELEGSLTRLVAFSSLTGRPVTASLAEEALREIFAQREVRRVTCELIQETVAEYFSISVGDMVSARRNREITVPRQVAMFLTREMVGLSLPRIGESFGGRDHTTVMHSCEKVQDIMKENAGFLSQMEDLRRLIKDGK